MHQPALQKLLGILDLEKIEEDLFRGRSHQTDWQRVFGGQVIGQALVAAQRTAPNDRRAHSLHCYFVRPGDPDASIVYRVTRIRDGRSFSVRRVVAIQHGEEIFTLVASFQIEEAGLEHQATMPADVPLPNELPDTRDVVRQAGSAVPPSIRRYWERERPLEIRPCDLRHYTSTEKLPPQQRVWIRLNGDAPPESDRQLAILAYLSDMTLLDTATFAHGRITFDPALQVASLDHAMWFHQPFPLQGWLLYVTDSPWTGGSRGLTRGQIFTEDGLLVASVTQEGLMRLRDLHKK